MNHLIHSRNTPPAAGIADSLAGIAIPFTPATLGNLVNWCEPQNLAFLNPPTNNVIKWIDTITGNFYQGTFIQKLTAPIRDITSLNGHNVLTMLSSTVNEYVAWSVVPGIENKQVYTFGAVLRIDQAAVGYAHAFRCNGLGGCNGFAAVRSNAGGKLELFTRSDNAVAITVISTTTFNGAGWQVIICQVDLTNGTARLIENGNDLNGAAAQNGVTWNAVNGTANLLNVALFAGYNQWWIGGLGEFFYYSDLKSNADINSLGNYLATKFGLSWVNI